MTSSGGDTTGREEGEVASVATAAYPGLIARGGWYAAAISRAREALNSPDAV